MTKIVIIGGVAGGASAAARARRLSEDAEIIMFERGPTFPLPTAACLITSVVTSKSAAICCCKHRKAF